MPRCLVIGLLLVSACSKNPRGGRPEVTPTASASAQPSPPDEDVVEVRAEPQGRGHAIVVVNVQGGPLALRSKVTVEKKETDSWVRIPAELLYLREKCSNPNGSIYEPPACVTIAPGATLRSAPWTHMIGDSQCACEECGPAGPGVYRFVIEHCDGIDSYVVPPFKVVE